MSKLQIGVIGTGSIGNIHLAGYAGIPKNVKIAALCDVTQARLDEMGEKYGVPPEKRYRDYKQMLASETLDAVSVCVPNYLHAPIAIDVIKRGINLLLEKPMVLTQADARKVRAALKANPVKMMIAFSHRFIKANISARKALGKSTIGKPYMIRVRYAHTGPYPGWAQSDWFYKPKQAGGGAMLDMGIHAIDICQFIIGPIETVSANIRTLRKKIQVDDNAVMLFDFGKEAACLGYVEVGWTSPSGFAGIEIMGDKGSMRLELGKDGIISRGIARPDGTVEVKDEVLASFGGNDHWPLQIESFVKYCLGQKTVTDIPGFDEGESSLAVALAAAESNKTGKRVKVKRLPRG